MKSLENMIAPDAIGIEKGRYLWDGSRHHVKNHLLAVFSFLGIILFAAANDFSKPEHPLGQILLATLIAMSAYFLIMAIHDQSLRHVKLLAIVGDRGFGIFKYNEVEELMLRDYVQTYDSLDHIEKRQRYDVSEEGVYLQTVCHYRFFAPEEKFHQKLIFNRYDVRLCERDGLPEVKAMKAIEESYAASKKAASITRVMESEEVIPSRPRPLISIKDAIMWADLKD